MRLPLHALALLTLLPVAACSPVTLPPAGPAAQAEQPQGPSVPAPSDEGREQPASSSAQLSALALSSAAVTAGARLTGTISVSNPGTQPVVVEQLVIALRPPGGTHAEGPFFDMAPSQAQVTLAPGASVTLEAERTFLDSDVVGRWEAYGTFQDSAGTWHDGASVFFDVEQGSEPPKAFPFTLRTCAATGATATASFPVTGASPDDDTDDHAAIQNAIDTARTAGGGVVTLPEGTFLVSRALHVKSNVKLAGAGPATVIKAGPSFLETKGPFGGHPLITTNDAANVTLSSFTADQSGDVLDGNVDGRLTEYLVDVRNSRNAVVENVHTRNPFTYSIAVVGSTEFCVRDSSTRVETVGRYNQLDGIHVLDSNTGEVLNNVVDQRIGADGDDGLVAHTIGSEVFGVVYAGNKVRGGSHGAAMQLAVGLYSVHSLIIESNEFWGSPNGLYTGYWDGNAPVRNVTVGGSPSTGNRFIDNGKDAVLFTGAVTNIKVSHNQVCRNGGIKVDAGTGNVVTNNTFACP